MPLVSVICCTHNREAWVRSHFEGMRAHLGENIELVYALDNCTDGTRAALEPLVAGYPNVRVLDHRGERGLFNCRNFGMAQACAPFIHFLDDDDSVEPGFYAQACQALGAEPAASADLYLARLRITGDAGPGEEREVMPQHLRDQAVCKGTEWQLGGDLFGPILEGQLYFNGANALYSAALLRRYGYRSELKKSADWLFILEAALRQPLRVILNTQMVANYHVHAASMSIGPDKAFWNARVFELLLAMADEGPQWRRQIQERCALANFHAAYAQRRLDRGLSRSLYWRSFLLKPRLQPLLAIAKTWIG